MGFNKLVCFLEKLGILGIGKGGRCILDSPVKLEDSQIETCEDFTTLQVNVSDQDEFNLERAKQFLLAIVSSRLKAFELIGWDGQCFIQIASPKSEAHELARHLLSYYPNLELFNAEDLLQSLKSELHVAHCYRLKHFAIPLETKFSSFDPYTSLMGIFSQMGKGIGLVQILFIRSRYKAYLSESSSTPEKAKLKEPLFAAAVRLASSSKDILYKMGKNFLKIFNSQFIFESRPNSPFFSDSKSTLTPKLVTNTFKPLAQSYPIPSIFKRTSHQRGMLLNLEELTQLVHLPSPKKPGFEILKSSSTRAKAPKLATEDIFVLLGINEYQGNATPVGISNEWLTRHVAILGATGSGKTTLLSQFFSPIKQGYGLVFVDLKGSGAEAFLHLIPESRIDDTIYLDFGDFNYPPALNILWASNEEEREDLPFHLVDVFKRLFSEHWGSQMEWILRQSFRILLALPGQKTLMDLPRLLSDDAYRREILKQIDDPGLLNFWKNDFPKLPKGAAISPILNRLSKFLDVPKIRNIVCQPDSIDFQRIMKEGKILICNLAKGGIGDQEAILIGSYILARLQIAVMARVRMPESQLKPFTVIVDEFHSLGGYGSDKYSIESLFSEARQFKVAFVTATQSLAKLRREIARDLLVNARTLICLNSGFDEAKIVEPELGKFSAEDLTNLKVGQAIARMERASEAFNFSFPEMKIPTNSFKEKIIAASRERYCRPRAEVEKMLKEEVNFSNRKFFEEEIEVEERRFLEFVIKNPDKPITEVYKALKLGTYKGKRIRKSLKEKGLIKELETHLGKGKTITKFIIPTFEALQLLGYENNGGRGGPIHRHLQRIIKEQALAKGFSATCERKIEDGIVDLHLERDIEKIAVEISITSSAEREVKNINKCLSNGYSKVFCLFLGEATLSKVEEKSKEIWSDDELNKLVLLPVSKFSGLF